MDITALKRIGKEDISLRPYQMDNKEKIYEAWKTHKSVMLQMPTGTGKTRLFVSLIKDIRKLSKEQKKDIKVLILVHRTELIDQISETLLHYEVGHGFIQSGDKERKFYAIQLASVQTLSRRLDSWNSHKFDVIIVDEAHHIKAESYKKIIFTFPDAYLLGVTATPYRLSGEGFSDVFETLIVSPSVKKFITDGFLSEYRYYSVRRSSYIQQQINAIKKMRQGDYDEEEMSLVCDNDRIRAQVVETYIKYANGKKGIVYTINREHNQHLCDAFREQGINAVALDAKTPGDERRFVIEKFREGVYQIICNVNLFSEGFDCPDIEFVQLARPTKSLSLFLQQVGRGLRKSDNKDKTIFLDNVGLYNRFGFPSSNRHWKYHFNGKEKTQIAYYENDKESPLESHNNKRRHNFTEGDEEVFLIQTSDEEAFLKERKERFLELYRKFNNDYDPLLEEYFFKELNKGPLFSTIKLTDNKYIEVEDNIVKRTISLEESKDNTVFEILHHYYLIETIDEKQTRNEISEPKALRLFIKYRISDVGIKIYRKTRKYIEDLHNLNLYDEDFIQVGKDFYYSHQPNKPELEHVRFWNLIFYIAGINDIQIISELYKNKTLSIEISAAVEELKLFLKSEFAKADLSENNKKNVEEIYNEFLG